MIKATKKGEPILQILHCVRKPVPPGTKRRGPRPLRGTEWGIPPILVQILTTGLRRIQALGQDRNPERCTAEAEHMQSLPALVVDFDPEVFDRYWNAKRIAFVQKCSPAGLAEFEPHWRNLADVLQTCKDEHARGEA